MNTEEKLREIVYRNWKLGDEVGIFTEARDLFAKELFKKDDEILAITRENALEDNICRFNDGEQSCDCFIDGYSEAEKRHIADLTSLKEKIDHYSQNMRASMPNDRFPVAFFGCQVPNHICWKIYEMGIHDAIKIVDQDLINKNTK